MKKADSIARRRQTGDSGALLLRNVEASTGILSQIVDALKR